MKKYMISPSILAADIASLGEEVTNVIAAGADMIHIDVMDNHYVPNLTFGPMICYALRNYGIKVPLDVHLMVEPVDSLIPEFAKAGATYITFHPEASQHVHRSLQLIRDQGCKSGLALNPATPLNVLDYVLEEVDIILIMSVNPGFGGQQFIPETLSKLKAVNKMIQGRDIRLEIDGGVTTENIRKIADAGADTFVAGTAIFNGKDYSGKISKMRQALQA